MQERTVVVTVSPQSRASLAAAHGLTPSQAIHRYVQQVLSYINYHLSSCISYYCYNTGTDEHQPLICSRFGCRELTQSV